MLFRSATFKNNIKGFAVRILLKEPDRRIRPGMTANIEIPVSAVDNVVAAPLAAVFTEQNPETTATERFAYVKKGATIERRPVQIGISDFFFAEIQSGLAAGDVVMLELPKEGEVTIVDAAPAIQTAGTTPATGGAQAGQASGVPKVGGAAPKAAGPTTPSARRGS